MTIDEVDVIIGRTEVASDSEGCREAIISIEGSLLLVNKPYGETSFFAVNKIRQAITRATGIKRVKVGHAGTLDPLATGLLILATRGKTKELSQLLGLPKSYTVEMRLGITSPSFDLERPISIGENATLIDTSTVVRVIEGLVGIHAQTPPIFSAVKQQGKPVYLAARRGEDVVMVPKEIEIFSSKILSIQLPFVRFRVECSKGTYIRSLVRDIAATLGTVGLMTALERDSIAGWRSEEALTIEEVVGLLVSGVSYSTAEGKGS